MRVTLHGVLTLRDKPEEVDPEAPLQGGGGGEAPGDSTTWAAIHAEDRKFGLKFCISRPLSKMVMMRITLEPLRMYLCQLFRLASTDYGKREEAKLAAALLRGHPPAARRYPVTEYASGNIDNIFFKALDISFKNDLLWGLVPPVDQTVAARALAFRMLARSGAAVEQLLASEHRKAPWLTCLLVEGSPDLVAKMRALPDCMLDPWSQEFRRDYPTLSGEEPLAVLHLLRRRSMRWHALVAALRLLHGHSMRCRTP